MIIQVAEDDKIYYREDVETWAQLIIAKKSEPEFKTKILMSRTNHEGYKLEELLQNIIDDLHIKSQMTVVYGNDTVVEDIINIIKSNCDIIELLQDCINIQKGTMEYMKKFGPNKGPKKPRI
jgi:hypothetical protein